MIDVEAWFVLIRHDDQNGRAMHAFKSALDLARAEALEDEARSDKYDRPCEDKLLDAAERYRGEGS